MDNLQPGQTIVSEIILVGSHLYHDRFTVNVSTPCPWPIDN